jgi:thiol:disulfide interchange protein
MNRAWPRLILIIVSLFVAGLASAGEVPYDAAQFEKLKAEGKPVAVAFHADWCGTCKAQKPALHDALNTQELKDVTLFVVNFDREKKLVKSLNVLGQSTIVVFKEGKEVGRSIGVVDKDKLAALLKLAVS